MSATLAATLNSLAAASTPAVVWHDSGGERIELSGRVLVNWVAKTTHLLAEDLDVGEGSVLDIHLGEDHLHWRGLVIALAGLARNAAVRLPGDPPLEREHRIAVVTDDNAGRAGEAETADDVLAVALPGLAMRSGAPLGDAMDYVAEVRSHPDAYPFVSPLAIDARLGTATGTETSVLLAPRRPLTSGILARALGVVAAGGIVGLTNIGDQAKREVLARQEGLIAEL